MDGEFINLFSKLQELEQLLKQRSLKGGAGSGHWGHSGRPGTRGGSSSSSVAMSIRTGRDAKQRQAAAAKKKRSANNIPETTAQVVRDLAPLYGNDPELPVGVSYTKGATSPAKKCLREEGFCHNNALDYVKNNKDAILMAGMFINDEVGGNLGVHSWVKEGGETLDPTLGKHNYGLVGYEVSRDNAMKIKSDAHLEAALFEVFGVNDYGHPEIDATIDLIK